MVINLWKNNFLLEIKIPHNERDEGLTRPPKAVVEASPLETRTLVSLAKSASLGLLCRDTASPHPPRLEFCFCNPPRLPKRRDSDRLCKLCRLWEEKKKIQLERNLVERQDLWQFLTGNHFQHVLVRHLVVRGCVSIIGPVIETPHFRILLKRKFCKKKSYNLMFKKKKKKWILATYVV